MIAETTLVAVVVVLVLEAVCRIAVMFGGNGASFVVEPRVACNLRTQFRRTLLIEWQPIITFFDQTR